MTKLLSILSLVAFSALSFTAQAASHAGGAPMKASAPDAAASGHMKADKKHAAKAEKKAEKKEEKK